MNPIFNLHASVYLTAIGMPLPRSDRQEHDDIVVKDVAIERASFWARAKTGLRALADSLREAEGHARPDFYADRWLGP